MHFSFFCILLVVGGISAIDDPLGLGENGVCAEGSVGKRACTGIQQTCEAQASTTGCTSEEGVNTCEGALH